MPLDPDQIANYSENELRERARRKILGERRPTEESYVSPHFGDGGSHTQVGALKFDPRYIQPLGDHVLVEVYPEAVKQLMITLPDIARNLDARSRIGRVLKIGPGAWKDTKTHKDRHMFIRLPMTLKPGDLVVIGQYADWESWDADYEGRGRNIVLCQEADIRGTIEVPEDGDPN